VTLSGVIPLRNAVQLGYPFELAIASLRMLCDEVVVLVDPTSDDDTVARVCEQAPHKVVESAWDMRYRPGENEIAEQTKKACSAASGEWIFSLQADELLHEDDIEPIREAIETAEREGATGIELQRLYFYGSLRHIREDWTLYLTRLFKRRRWAPNFDAMSFDPCIAGERCLRSVARIFHYSRIGDSQQVAERVRNLDRFYHPGGEVRTDAVEPYDFGHLRKLDTYVVGHVPENAEAAVLVAFPLDAHPTAALRHFLETTP
jgi:hypothetical protein